MFAAFSIKGFAPMWGSGLLWHVSRWGMAFLSAYLVNDLTDSPRLVQLTGAALWAPLLVGGVLGGVVADRFERRRTVRVQLAILIPCVVGMAWLVSTERIEVWMLYPFLFIVGIGWVVDMTSRRSLIYDLVGPERIDNAMAMESLSLSGGIVLGTLIGGSAVSMVGIGGAFLIIAGLLCIGMALMSLVDPSPPSHGGATSPLADLRAGLALARTNSRLRAVLGVTVIANFFLFAYFPLVQVIAAELGAGPLGTGLLASATGLGMMTGSTIIARHPPRRRGMAYLGGTFGAMTLLIGFALAQWYPAAIAFLYLSSIGAGFFGATQSTLVMTVVDDNVRGRAMGLLSMGIGALPVGMFFLGELAESLGTRTAMTIWLGIGALALIGWHRRHRELAATVTSTTLGVGVERQ